MYAAAPSDERPEAPIFLRRQLHDHAVHDDAPRDEAEARDDRRPGDLGHHRDRPARERRGGQNESSHSHVRRAVLAQQRVIDADEVQTHGDRIQRDRQGCVADATHHQVGDEPRVEGEPPDVQQEHRIRPVATAALGFGAFARPRHQVLEAVEHDEAEQCGRVDAQLWCGQRAAGARRDERRLGLVQLGQHPHEHIRRRCAGTE